MCNLEMRFRLLWSFLFISENALTPANILYKTLFWKQFNSSEFVSMKVIIIRRAICHTHRITPVILRLRWAMDLLLLLVNKIFFWKEKTYQASAQSLKRPVNYPAPPSSSLWLHFALNIYGGRSVGFSEEWEEAQRVQEWMYVHKQPHGNLSCSG